MPHSVVCSRSSGAIGVAGELVEQTLIILAKLRALELAENGRQERIQKGSSVVDVVKNTLQEVGNTLLQSVESETSEVISFKQVAGVKNTASEVFKLNSSERVHFTCVSANLQALWVSKVANTNVGNHIIKPVGSSRWATVPVVGDALLSSVPDE